MTISMSQLTRPALERGLTMVSNLLTKADAQRAHLKIEETTLLQSRLHPDMFPLARQVQLASDAAKATAARLAGVESPKMPDTETSFAELQERIVRTLQFVRSVSPEAIDAAETRKIEIPRAGGALTYDSGLTYLLEFALPNFYFHLTTAYGLLRQAGVDIGKRDYLSLG